MSNKDTSQLDYHSIDSWLPLVYDELKRVAAMYLAKEQFADSLQATDLVHEVYIRLSKEKSEPTEINRRHLFGAAGIAIRRILVDRARSRMSVKRGGEVVRHYEIELAQIQSPVDRELILLDEALKELADKEPRIAELVHLRYFAGLSNDEAAAILGISPRTAGRHWNYARAWLKTQLAASDAL